MANKEQKTKRKPKRRKSALIEITNGFLTLLILGLIVTGGAFFYFAKNFYADGSFVEDKVFTVQKGSGLASIATKLRDEGIIANVLIFQLGARSQKLETSIKTGEYRIAKGSSMADVLKEITQGAPITYGVTLAEGLTSWQVVNKINAAEYLVGEIIEIPAEGTLLPDTYSFERGEDRAAIIKRMSSQLDKELAQVWANRSPDLPIKTPQELLILASLIEKETGTPTERAEVAGVFINRLNQGMKLQTDPTVIYGITLGKEKLGRGLRQSELKKETPYNTYIIPALPIGPIANPGRASLQAAANPAKTDNIFFVAAGAYPSEGHLFAATYKEHKKNVALYRAAVAQEEARLKAEAEAKENETPTSD
jgi:UPF0755 protein